MLVALAIILGSVGASTGVFAGVMVGALLVLAGIEILVFGLRPTQRAVGRESLPIHAGGVVHADPPPEPQEPEEAPLEPETSVTAVVAERQEPERVPQQVELATVPPLPPEPEPVAPEADGGAVVDLPLRGGPREWDGGGHDAG